MFSRNFELVGQFGLRGAVRGISHFGRRVFLSDSSFRKMGRLRKEREKRRETREEKKEERKTGEERNQSVSPFVLFSLPLFLFSSFHSLLREIEEEQKEGTDRGRERKR